MAPATGKDEEEARALVGRLVGERYQIERYVARGGFGSVYRATHVGLSAPVALKVLSTSLGSPDDADTVEQFRREARTLAALKHPAIVRVLDIGRLDPADGARVWMALEWIDGVTLEEDLRARAGRGRSPREALDLLAPAFDAIASAHGRGVVHRDLKPANLMVSPGDRGDVRLRVLDFGIAKEMLPDEAPGSGQTETHSTTSAFSLQHAAPEQVGRARTGPWTDVHALGLLLTEVLTGRRAYRGDTSFDLYAEVMATGRPTPAAAGLLVGPWETVLCKALALRPDERFVDAGELYAALAAGVDEAQAAWSRVPLVDTVVARPEAPPAGGRGRRRLAFALVALAGSALVAIAALRSGHPAPHPPTRAAAPTPTPIVVPAVASPAVLVSDDVAAPAPTPPAATPRPGPHRARPTNGARPIRGDGDPEVMVE